MRLFLPILMCVSTFGVTQSELASEAVIDPFYPEAKNGVIKCLSNEAWNKRSAELGLRAPGLCDEGSCDDPVVRDGTSVSATTVDVIVHVMRDNNGNGGVSQSTVNATIAQMNADYANNGTNIQFNLVATRFHNDSTYACISAYSPFSSTWYNEIIQMRRDYNETPDQVCNIYISCQDSSFWGILLGIATFPWDPVATSAEGGLWLNNIATGSGATTPSHEMGHCLGLWHTHHGVSEVDSCSTCYETADGLNGDATGDFCSDTPPTPTNQNCSDPGGSDCQSTPWGNTQEENIMGYAPDSCRTLLTNQQTLRMHCWANDTLSGWLGGGTTPTNNPPTASFTYNANNLAVSFDGTGSSDSDGTITGYSWNFGDGNTGSGATTSHTYASAGTYTVTLTVTDDDSATDDDSQSVTVTSGGTGGTWTTLSSSDFESGLQGWTDGGSDCRRSANDSAYASQGTYCVRLRDNTSTSVMTRSESLNGYTEARVSFSFYIRSFENNEDFWLQVNDGSGWSTVATYIRNSANYNNNQFYSDTVSFDSGSFSFGANVQIRFRADASGNSDWVYIDEVVVEAR